MTCCTVTHSRSSFAKGTSPLWEVALRWLLLLLSIGVVTHVRHSAAIAAPNPSPQFSTTSVRGELHRETDSETNQSVQAAPALGPGWLITQSSRNRVSRLVKKREDDGSTKIELTGDTFSGHQRNKQIPDGRTKATLTRAQHEFTMVLHI